MPYCLHSRVERTDTMCSGWMKTPKHFFFGHSCDTDELIRKQKNYTHCQLSVNWRTSRWQSAIFMRNYSWILSGAPEKWTNEWRPFVTNAHAVYRCFMTISHGLQCVSKNVVANHHMAMSTALITFSVCESMQCIHWRMKKKKKIEGILIVNRA